jgi:hypothetical protein
VVDAGGHRFAQHGQRGIMVAERPKNAGAGKLHRPVAEALYSAVTKEERKTFLRFLKWLHGNTPPFSSCGS